MMRRIVRLGIVVLVVSYLTTALASYTFTRRFASTPIDHHPNAETIALTTSDRETIRGWWFADADARAVALLVHGNGGNRRSMLEMANALQPMGVEVLAITVRAHGDSSGETNDFGYSARHDVFAAVDWIRGRRPRRPLVVVGASLGAAASVLAAESVADRVDAYVLESPYASIDIATKNRTDMFLPDPLSAVVAWSLGSWSRWFIGVPTEQIAPIDRAQHIPRTVEVDIIAGAADRHATMDEMRAYERALDGHVRLHVFEGAAHAQPWWADRSRYLDILRRVVDHVAERG